MTRFLKHVSLWAVAGAIQGVLVVAFLAVFFAGLMVIFGELRFGILVEVMLTAGAVAGWAGLLIGAIVGGINYDT